MENIGSYLSSLESESSEEKNQILSETDDLWSSSEHLLNSIKRSGLRSLSQSIDLKSSEGEIP